MSFLIYQRSDPRCPDWAPLVTQQVRLRNVIQIIALNLEVTNGEEEVYFTLHARAMSTPFFTSEKLKGGKRVLTWREVEPRQFGDNVRLSAPGCIVRVWSSPLTIESSNAVNQEQPIMSWCVYFTGLMYLGLKGDWNTRDFSPNTLLFRMPFGFFTSTDCLLKPPLSSQRYLQLLTPSASCRESYTVKSLAALHDVQRSVLDEAELARQLKGRISLFGYSTESIRNSSSSLQYNLILGDKALLRVQQGKIKIQLKESIEAARQRVTVLKEEKCRTLERCNKLKKEKSVLVLDELTMDLLSRMQILGREKDRLRELKFMVQEKRHLLTQQCSKLFLRRKQLISELLLIYPLALVEGSKRFSINEVQLPNAEDYGSEVGGQISVALGYTAHLVAMLSFFLGIPLRYLIRHFGSRSRIVDHITVQIPDKEREFPLYFTGKEDVYSKYAVYLLNKNIAQLRWYCGLSTSDLRASLPNLHNLLTNRLTIPGWPPSPGETLEVAQELTEEVDQQLFKNEFSVSLDKGLDQLDPPQKAFENVWLRTSISNFECAGGNAVPEGEVKHGKAQDRFLNGWRKKTYESEVIDPNWLTNSLNLEFDGGRRLSNILNPSISVRPLPTIVVSEDEKQPASRKRRLGRVEHMNPYQKPSRCKTPEYVLPTGETPNDNLSQLENHIKHLERRRSFCGDSGRNSGEGTPSPTHTHQIQDIDNPSSTETEKDQLQDHVADLVRRMSLVEMQMHRRKPSDIDEGTEILDPVQAFDEDDVELVTEHLATIYDHSSDERGGTPSPSFFRTTSHINSEEFRVNVQDENLEKETTLENPCELLRPNSLEITNNTDTNVPLNSNSSIDFPLYENENHENNFSNDCDSVSNFGNGTEEDDSSTALWLRTEALEALLCSQSFNQVKRRISESK